MKKQSLLKGTIILGVAGITAKFLGIFFRWPLIMLIGDEGVGYYQMSYPLYTFFVAVASGIPVAVSKMVSEKSALGDMEGSREVLDKAFLLMIIIGGGFSAVLFIFSKNLISIFKWDARSYYSLIGIAWAPIFISVLGAFRGFFQGLQNMSPTAVSQIIEQFGRVIIGVGLAYLLLGRGIEFSAGGAAFGAAAGGILAGVYLIIVYVRNMNSIFYSSGPKIKRFSFFKTLYTNYETMNKLLYIAIPISLGATVGTIMSLIDSLLVPQLLLSAGFSYKQSTILFGQLTGKAFVLVNVPLTLSVALCASIVPIIAEAFILNNKKEVFMKVQSAMKISMVIAIPSCFGLFCMASPILQLIFPGHSDGYLILRYLSICIPFIILAQTSTAVLQASGKYLKPVLNLGIGCLVKILITYLLVPVASINIYGSVIGTILGYITASLLNMITLRREMKIRINFYEVLVKPLFASIIMIVTVAFLYIVVISKTGSNALSCLVSVFTGVIIYAIFIVMFGIFKYDYVKNRLLRRKTQR